MKNHYITLCLLKRKFWNSIMKRMNLAIEDIDVNCDVQECPEDTTIPDLEKDDQLISLQQDDLNQAEDISDTIGTIATDIDTSTGLSDDAAQVLNVVTEHFCRRLGYKHPIVPALESFNDTTRVQNTKIAIENLNKLNTQLVKSINIAQESLLNSIAESIVGVFSKEKELKMEVKRLKEETKNKQINVEEIPAKNWTTHLRTDSSIISGKDVLEITGKLKKVVSSDEILRNVKDLSGLVKSIKNEVKGTWFKANQNAINKIADKYNTVHGIINEFDRDFLTTGKGDMKTLTPLSEEERNHILSDVESILTSKDIEKEFNTLAELLSDLTDGLTVFLNSTPGGIAATVGAVGGIMKTNSMLSNVMQVAMPRAAMTGGIPAAAAVAITLVGLQIIIHGGIVMLKNKVTNSDIILSEDSKSFKLVINKTIKEIEEILKSYRELTAEKLKICSAALNYVKASVY